ncbi:MAG: hypothetical protein Tsb002_09230 [Wenzhouxiangellaceae bacterium]
MAEKIVNADTPEGQAAGEEVVEVIERQLSANDPPEVNEALCRLMSNGETRENAIRYIAGALIVEILAATQKNEPYNPQRYKKNLERLPREPID